MGEQERAEKFITLAEARTNKALNAIRLLGNLSNKASYKYTEDQVNQIFETLEQQLRDTKKRFFTSAGEREHFKLKCTAEPEPSAAEDASEAL